ncbi:MAG: GNAT family N-acetyltransferase [Ferruginibacter sp.]
MPVSYTSYPGIDKQKWDALIHRSSNGLIYAHSFYLDSMAETWDALILDDYAAVMPLVYRKKWGIRYLYQPAFTQQLGIFSEAALTDELISEFLSVMSGQFRFAEIALNYRNFSAYPGIATTTRNNYILKLSQPYAEVYAGFPHSITKNINRAKKFNLQYQKVNEYRHIIALYKELYQQKMHGLREDDYIKFEKLCFRLAADDRLIVREVYYNDELVAAAILPRDERRIYNVVSCTTTRGRNVEANYFLFNELIREFAGTGTILDFEGSDVKSIGEFYNRFTPENQPYPFISFNSLPTLIKLLKRLKSG